MFNSFTIGEMLGLTCFSKKVSVSLHQKRCQLFGVNLHIFCSVVSLCVTCLTSYSLVG